MEDFSRTTRTPKFYLRKIPEPPRSLSNGCLYAGRFASLDISKALPETGPFHDCIRVYSFVEKTVYSIELLKASHAPFWGNSEPRVSNSAPGSRIRTFTGTSLYNNFAQEWHGLVLVTTWFGSGCDPAPAWWKGEDYGQPIALAKVHIICACWGPALRLQGSMSVNERSPSK